MTMGDLPVPNNTYMRIDLDQAVDAPVQERRGSGSIRWWTWPTEAGSRLRLPRPATRLSGSRTAGPARGAALAGAAVSAGARGWEQYLIERTARCGSLSSAAPPSQDGQAPAGRCGSLASCRALGGHELFGMSGSTRRRARSVGLFSIICW